MSYTPGPWTARDQGEGPRGKSLGIVISGRNHLPLFFLPRGKPEEGMANAYLVAAAPDLLEALKGVIRVADRETTEFNAARAAIAKAEGGA